jgi:hypothetical protein
MSPWSSRIWTLLPTPDDSCVVLVTVPDTGDTTCVPVGAKMSAAL